MEVEKPFKCSVCSSRFTNEDHLQVHKKRHEMSLNLSKSGLNLGNAADGFVDETPTPTRFIRNCEEVGLFQDLQNVNPFDEQFTKATSATPSNENFEFNFCITTTTTTTSSTTASKKLPDDTLNTPQVFGYNPASASIPETVLIPPIAPSTIQNPGVSTTSSEISETDNGQDFSQNSKTSDEPMVVGCTAEDTKVESTTPDNESFVPPIFSIGSKAPSKLKLNFTGAIDNNSNSHELLSNSPSAMVDQQFGAAGEDDEGDEGVVFIHDPYTDASKPNKKARKAVDMDGKKAELLERNRAAASRSRERRKQWVSGLEARCQTLQTLLSQAQTEVAKLRVENNFLREELVKHGNCDVTRAEPRQRASTPRTPEFQPPILKHSSSASSHINRSITGTSVITATTITTAASVSNSMKSTGVPAVQVKPKRGRPRKGFEKRAEGIVIPTSVTSSTSSSNNKVPQVTSISNESGVPVKVEILPVKSVDGQQLTNLFIVKRGT